MPCRPVDARHETPGTVVVLESRLDADLAGIVTAKDDHESMRPESVLR